MKKSLSLIAGVLSLSLLMGGCSWMDGYYHHATAHMQEQQSKDPENITVSSYIELRNAVERLVEQCAQKRIVYTHNMDRDAVEKYMQMITSYVQVNNPIGAYALESINYAVGTNVGGQAIAMDFRYRHLRSEIMQVKRTETMDEAIGLITSALNNCDPGVTMLVSHYTETDLTQLIQDYVTQNPDKCMEMPQISAMVYPEHGDRRVLEISFRYQNSRDVLRNMQETVGPIFASAELYVQGNAQEREKLAQLYSFLMERYDYTYETSITPAYSLLRHGIGDAKAFAVVYGAMCRAAGIPCQIVQGTKEGVPACWNEVTVNGISYYIDLIDCAESGGFRLKNKEGMRGYVWDYSAYP